MNLPGFTAEVALYENNRRYQARGQTTMKEALGDLRLAVKKHVEPDYLDCKEWPNNLHCRECGASGPDSAICCPSNYCLINNPPDTPDAPVRKWGFHGPVTKGVFARR